MFGAFAKTAVVDVNGQEGEGGDFEGEGEDDDDGAAELGGEATQTSPPKRAPDSPEGPLENKRARTGRNHSSDDEETQMKERITQQVLLFCLS